jgi:hypothetical protein
MYVLMQPCTCPYMYICRCTCVRTCRYSCPCVRMSYKGLCLCLYVFICSVPYIRTCQSQWPPACQDCGFESRRGHGCLSLMNVVCCKVEISASGRSLVQRSPTECGVSECDLETWKDQDGTASFILVLLVSCLETCMTYIIAECKVNKLLMMDTGTVRNMYSFMPE